jgi:aryl-alcohol dehydrogenase-like predicted oxidoreductase
MSGLAGYLAALRTRPPCQGLVTKRRYPAPMGGSARSRGDDADPLRGFAAVGAGFFGGGGTPTALIGRGVDEHSAMEILDRSLELGLTLIDTAHSYAGGESERVIGRWLSCDAGRRRRVAIIDKLGAFDRDGKIVFDLTPTTIFRCVEESLSRLGVDSIDVLMPHAPDPATSVRTTLGTLAELIDRGHARCWGVSNVSAAGLEKWLDAARELGVSGPVLVENEYNLLARTDEADVIPLCRQYGIGYLAYSPLAGGVLTGKYVPGELPPPGSRLALRPEVAGPMTEAVQPSIDALRRDARSHGVSSAALALAWVMRGGPTVRPIVGASRTSHLDAIAQAMTLHLQAEEWAEIMKAFVEAAG